MDPAPTNPGRRRRAARSPVARRIRAAPAATRRPERRDGRGCAGASWRCSRCWAAWACSCLRAGWPCSPTSTATWRVEADDVVELVASPLSPLKGLDGAHLERISGRDGREPVACRCQPAAALAALDASTMRTRQQQLDSAAASVAPARAGRGDAALCRRPAGGRGTPAHAAWRASEPSSGCSVPLALVLGLVTAIVLISHPHWRNLPYALIGLCQGSQPAGHRRRDAARPGAGRRPMRSMACWRARPSTCAAPRRWSICRRCSPCALPSGRWIAIASWSACAALLALAARQALPLAWWWTQAGMLGCGVVDDAADDLVLPAGAEPLRAADAPAGGGRLRHAAAAQRRGGCGQLATRTSPRAMPALSSVIWYLFLSTLILLLPMFSRVAAS